MLSWFTALPVCAKELFPTGESIKVSEEIIDWQYRKTQSDTDEIKPLNMNQILQADDDVSQWKQRHTEWHKKQSQNAK